MYRLTLISKKKNVFRHLFKLPNFNLHGLVSVYAPLFNVKTQCVGLCVSTAITFSCVNVNIVAGATIKKITIKRQH